MYVPIYNSTSKSKSSQVTNVLQVFKSFFSNEVAVRYILIVLFVLYPYFPTYNSVFNQTFVWLFSNVASPKLAEFITIHNGTH